MRVLIVYEDSHRAYGDALERAVRGQGPGVEVLLVQARRLTGEVERFDPHLVVSGLPNTVDPGGRAAWVTLSEDPDGPSGVRGGAAQGGAKPRDGRAAGRHRRDGGAGPDRGRVGRLLGTDRSLPTLYSPECVEG
jgi:hypothetical protein